MKTALVLCPKWDSDYPLSSFALLSAQLKKNGHEVEILDMNHAVDALDFVSGVRLETHTGLGDAGTSTEFVQSTLSWYGGWFKDLARKILANGCRLVGFSLYYSNNRMSLEFAKILKEMEPGVKIVLGGPDCLTFSNCLEYIRKDGVDAVVFGEGDISLPRLVNGYEKTGELLAGPGILLKNDESTWKEVVEVPRNLDEFPRLDYSGFPMLETYSGKTIHTARGCIRKCVFCRDWREMSFRRMSGRRIFDEFAHQLDVHPRMNSFMFGDSILNSSMPELLEFCGLVCARDMPISWRGYAIVRPDLTPQALEKMRRAGCRELFYGIESGSDQILRDMGKGVPPALNADILRRTSEAGILTMATWMIGFPSETEERFEESLDFLRTNAKSIGRLGCSLFSVREMRAQAERFNFAPEDDQIFWKTRDGKNTFPLRLARARRTLEVAEEAGIPARCWNISSVAAWRRYEEEAMDRYEWSLSAAGRS